MKKNEQMVDGDLVTLVDEPNELTDDLPESIDFSSLRRIANPVESMIMLDDDVAKYFKSAKQVNDYLRQQIKQFKSAVL